MAAIEVFSSSANYKYKSKTCSLSALVVLFFIILTLLTPFYLIYNAGGIWLRNRVHVETPNVSFNYKYLMLAERDFKVQPVVCSSFASYLENEIEDNCIIVKVQETDTNNDGRKDILKFEAHFYTDEPIKSIKLLLFFDFHLEQLFEATIESIAAFDRVVSQEAQSITFFGDLELRQKGLLRSEGLYEVYNHNIELADYTLDELLMHSSKKKFSAKISNAQVSWEAGYSSADPVVVRGELFYREHIIYYQPSLWEELKWAWIQYLSCLLVCAYLAKRILIFLFSNRYLNAYIVEPWRSKYK